MLNPTRISQLYINYIKKNFSSICIISIKYEEITPENESESVGNEDKEKTRKNTSKKFLSTQLNTTTIYQPNPQRQTISANPPLVRTTSGKKAL